MYVRDSGENNVDKVFIRDFHILKINLSCESSPYGLYLN